jgi:ADP-heptose:LPS heptosyltransferase
MRYLIKKIEYYWRRLFVYPVLHLFINNPEINKPLDISSIKKLLILRYDRIGDMIVTTPILRGLKIVKPDLFIGIVASSKNVEIIKNNPNVDKIYVLPSKWRHLWNEIKKIREEGYNLVLNFVFIKMTLGGIFINLIAPKSIKIGQGEQRHKFFYNRLLSVERHSRPMVEVLMNYVKEAIGIDIAPLNYDYEIITDEKTRAGVLSFLDKNNLIQRQLKNVKSLQYIVFNLSVNDTVRRISNEQAFAIGEYLNSRTEFRTVLLHAPNDSLMLSVKEQLAKKTQCLVFPEQYEDASLLEIAFLIEGALAVITPDTSIIHFASASKTPVLGFYASLLHEWFPYKVKNKIILTDKNQPVSSIPIPIMIESIKEFIATLSLPISYIT